MRLTTPVARPWAALLAAALLTACTVPGDNDLNNQSAATPGVKVAEGALACPTDGASSLTFTDVAGTAVEGIGPGETVNEHEVEVPAGCPVNSLTFRIEWDNELEDLDIELKYAGDVVGSSGAFNALDGAFEEISLSDPAPGVYTLVVKSYLNIETSYRGSAEALASLACQPGDGKSAEIESGLLADLANASPEQLFEVVVSYRQSRPITSTQVAWLNEIGLRGIHFRYLPIAGLLATPAQIEQLAQNPDVRSIWPNYELSYEDETARYLSSNDQAEAAADQGLVNSANLPYTGAGVTILVNDSGVDGTHLDLLFGEKLQANASGHADLSALNSVLPFDPTDGIPHSDLLGSHGTHVAGIAAGSGAVSGGQLRGSAPGATLAGYGSGAILLVLNSLGGFDYALRLLDTRPELNLRIVTNSFGQTSDQGSRFNLSDPTNIATKELADRDMIVVFSAGNQGSGPDSITGNIKKAPWVMVAAAGNKDGMLGGYSSRGALADGTYETTVGCETFTVTDRPTVVTTGTDYIATRATSTDPLGPANYPGDLTSEELPPQYAPFYTINSGTSMAAPHLAGLAALLLEANPDLKWPQVKQIMETTATNMPGYEPWEVGAGHANIEAALAMASGLRTDYGLNNHVLNPAKASITLGASTKDSVTIDFVPVGEREEIAFEVAADTALVVASWTQPQGSPCTCAIVITDPNGNRYGCGIALPLLARRVAAVGTGVPGTWTLSVSGVGGVSGQDVDPLGLTNGYAGPATLDVDLEQIAKGERTGLDDIAGHPAAALIEKAVVERLIDGNGSGVQPDAELTRGDFAQYLMSWGVRQTRSHSKEARFFDVDGALEAAAEAVTQRGQLLLDRSADSAPLILTADGNFNPGAAVSRQEVAYALIQAMGRESVARSYSGDLYALNENEEQVLVVDGGDVAAEYVGHVQDAILRGVIDVRFSDDGSQAFLEPTRAVNRAEYASMAVSAFLQLPFDL